MQRALEAQYDSLVDRQNLSAWMKRLSARPHHLGSPYDKLNAEFIDSLFTVWGYDTHIETFDVLFPTPKERKLRLVAPDTFTALLEEPAIKGDVSSGHIAERLPPYNAYASDGEISGQVVYVNQGIPRDYEVLERLGIDVKGKIVIA
jgi:N-acetylated-alpha-linked acidic dipeptidase